MMTSETCARLRPSPPTLELVVNWGRGLSSPQALCVHKTNRWHHWEFSPPQLLLLLLTMMRMLLVVGLRPKFGIPYPFSLRMDMRVDSGIPFAVGCTIRACRQAPQNTSSCPCHSEGCHTLPRWPPAVHSLCVNGPPATRSPHPPTPPLPSRTPLTSHPDQHVALVLSSRARTLAFLLRAHDLSAFCCNLRWHVHHGPHSLARS
jgi:hypothetical protein